MELQTIIYALLVFAGNAIWRLQRRMNPQHPKVQTARTAKLVYLASLLCIAGFAGLYFELGIWKAIGVSIAAVALTAFIP